MLDLSTSYLIYTNSLVDSLYDQNILYLMHDIILKDIAMFTYNTLIVEILKFFSFSKFIVRLQWKSIFLQTVSLKHIKMRQNSLPCMMKTIIWTVMHDLS